MQSASSFTENWPNPDCDPGGDQAGELMALSEQTFRLVAVAQALVASSRHVDVNGLQHHVGLLCAKALDLPPSKTGFVKIELKRLAASLDALKAAMQDGAAA